MNNKIKKKDNLKDHLITQHLTKNPENIINANSRLCFVNRGNMKPKLTRTH